VLASVIGPPPPSKALNDAAAGTARRVVFSFPKLGKPLTGQSETTFLQAGRANKFVKPGARPRDDLLVCSFSASVDSVPKVAVSFIPIAWPLQVSRSFSFLIAAVFPFANASIPSALHVTSVSVVKSLLSFLDAYLEAVAPHRAWQRQSQQ
jgi:hypothetical protein